MNTPIIVEGDSPIILGFPHTGTDISPPVAARLNPVGMTLTDTDWHLHRLYDGLLDGVTTLRTPTHRYVIDVNRDPAGTSLYPGQNTTALVPLTDFDDRPIWRDGQAPDTDEIADRLVRYHQPYHAAFAEQVERVRARHGVAIVFDCHSIRSQIPFLFAGTLPDFNVGTNDGRSCAAQVERTGIDTLTTVPGYTSVLNGRFKGGWTTRHYGRPATGVHAIQLELAQSTYLAAESVPFAYHAKRAARVRPQLANLLAGLDRLARSGALKETSDE